MDAYYKDYAKDFPMVVRAAWGYTVETATQAIAYRSRSWKEVRA